MSRKSRMKNLREAKDKRAKRIAIGGAVVLVVVLAIQVPRLLKHSGSSSPTPAATTTAAGTGATTTPTSTPTTAPAASGATAVASTASTKLPDSDTAPSRTKSQLYSFSHFAGKDPFVQQVAVQTGTSPTAPASSPSPAPSGNITTAATSHTGGQRTSSRTLAGGGTATISVNGKVQAVRVGASFPSSNPLFRLVSIAHGVARIGIASGSYATGAQTVSLASGRPVTLADTADGLRYQLRLISAS